MDAITNCLGEYCDPDNAVVVPWDKMKRCCGHTNYAISLNNLCGYGGSPLTSTYDSGLYGAEILPAEVYSPYYERNFSDILIAPWLGQSQEATYMNRTKVLNEPPVKTYKEIKLVSIPLDKYEKYEGIENFEENGINLKKHFILKIILIISLVILFLYLMMKFKW